MKNKKDFEKQAKNVTKKYAKKSWWD
jgi:hypothetical protein